MRCPRCGSFLLDGVVHVEDTPDGLFAVTELPVADHVLDCPCGIDIAVTSARPVAVHPGQLTLMQGAA